MFYRGANAALLLYDITNSSTFEDVRGWLEGNALSSVENTHALSLPLPLISGNQISGTNFGFSLS